MFLTTLVKCFIQSTLGRIQRKRDPPKSHGNQFGTSVSAEISWFSVVLAAPDLRPNPVGLPVGDTGARPALDVANVPKRRFMAFGDAGTWVEGGKNRRRGAQWRDAMPFSGCQGG